jgi:hypothetical protein
MGQAFYTPALQLLFASRQQTGIWQNVSLLGVYISVVIGVFLWEVPEGYDGIATMSAEFGHERRDRLKIPGVLEALLQQYFIPFVMQSDVEMIPSRAGPSDVHDAGQLAVSTLII